jgi:hypothetical protein
MPDFLNSLRHIYVYDVRLQRKCDCSEEEGVNINPIKNNDAAMLETVLFSTI